MISLNQWNYDLKYVKRADGRMVNDTKNFATNEADGEYWRLY